MKNKRRLTKKQVRALLKVAAATYVVAKALTKLGDKIDKAIDVFREAREK